LIVVSTVITDGWQTWQTVADNLFIEEGPHKLRMRVLAGGFNFNWFEFDFPDSDGDGVLDQLDDCPDTPENVVVDVNGCEIFNVTPDNYTIVASSETCRTEDNGSISLSAAENFDYTAVLSGENTSITENFTSEINFENLPAGTYTLCVTINSQPDYEQCFTVVVTQPDELIVTAGRPSSAKSMLKVSLSGSTLYYITLNNETFTTEQNEVELQLNPGINELTVKTNIDCQGIYKKTLFYDLAPTVYPNPAQNNLFISTDGLDVENLPVKIFDLTGKLIFYESYPMKDNQLKIDISNLSNGFFILKIVTNQKTYNYKIVKQ